MDIKWGKKQFKKLHNILFQLDDILEKVKLGDSKKFGAWPLLCEMLKGLI